MAMIKCEECGQEISSMAESCPHCGCKTSYASRKSKGKDYTIAMVVCFAVGAIGAFLFFPNLITLMDNYNDWYFWHVYTSRSTAVMQSIYIGLPMTSVGFGAMLGFARRARQEKSKESEQ